MFNEFDFMFMFEGDRFDVVFFVVDYFRKFENISFEFFLK